MSTTHEEFLRDLLSDFKIEASEHISSIEDGLFILEKGVLSQPDASVIERIYREMHSMKGASRAVGLNSMEKLCMSAETILSSVKKGESTLSKDIFDVLYMSLKALRFMLGKIDSSGKEIRSPDYIQVEKGLEFIINGISKKDGDKTKLSESLPAPITVFDDVSTTSSGDKSQETVRVTTAKLSKLLTKSEDLISVKTTLEYYFREISSINERIKDSRLEEVAEDLSRFIKISARITDDLIHEVKSTLLLPFSNLFSVLPRSVRELANSSNKEINLTLSGDDIQIDKRILEELKDPLIHIIRNCVDHGIEKPHERVATGKSPAGKISISVNHAADTRINIEISDDGRGIEIAKVLQSAIKNGIIDKSSADSLSDKEIIQLIFASGVSSSEIITELSGRGLGMAIVAEKVSALGGEISVDSLPGAGTAFKISVPQTITTFRGIVVRCCDKSFIIPSFSLERSIAIKGGDIKSYGPKRVFFIEGSPVGLYRLTDALGSSGLPKSNPASSLIQVMMLKSGKKKIAFSVDEVIGETECIVKSLGTQIRHLRKISGVTLTANGVITPIINVDELIEDMSYNEKRDISIGSSAGSDEVKRKRVLIAEDSITVRNMLKTIVEVAGFETEVAKDGADALSMIERGNFDIVVTDIEMPNMNGFELTAKLRSSSKFRDIPVILVTSLESKEDMERGLAAGANAYIVKGLFEKSNLTETINRLI